MKFFLAASKDAGESNPEGVGEVTVLVFLLLLLLASFPADNGAPFKVECVAGDATECGLREEYACSSTELSRQQRDPSDRDSLVLLAGEAKGLTSLKTFFS